MRVVSQQKQSSYDNKIMHRMWKFLKIIISTKRDQGGVFSQLWELRPHTNKQHYARSGIISVSFGVALTFTLLL